MCYMQAKIVISLDFKQICPSYSKIPRARDVFMVGADTFSTTLT